MHLAQPQQNKKNIVPTVNSCAAKEWQFWIIEATEHNKKSTATAFMYSYIKYFKKIPQQFPAVTPTIRMIPEISLYAQMLAKSSTMPTESSVKCNP